MVKKEIVTPEMVVKKVEQLEKRVAVLEEQVQVQPRTINNYVINKKG